MENLMDKVNKIVIKIGTAGITTDDRINTAAVAHLAKCCHELRGQGKYVTIVTSGAIAVGRRRLKAGKEGSLPEKQTYAAVGQPLLMKEYDEQFGRYGINVAQFLVSNNNFYGLNNNEALHASYYNTLIKDIVPVFNENDTLATEEIRFSDNDELQAFITTKLRQDIMINLITYDGLLKNGKVVEIATSYDKKDYDDFDREVREGRGGLQKKLDAIKMVNDNGKICLVGNVMGNIPGMVRGGTAHTRFLPRERF